LLPDIAAALAGFMLPFSWAAGLASRWEPSLHFEWHDYLRMWEYDDERRHFWSWFGGGFVLSVLLDASLLITCLYR
jgi:hypothetical protein